MRRKGQAPFSRRAIAAKSSNYIDKSSFGMDGKGMGGGDDGKDEMYSSMQRGLSDGMNHIAKSIMHSRMGGLSGGGSSGVINDMVSSTGELQPHRRENIPMRPLMINGAGGKDTDRIIRNNE